MICGGAWLCVVNLRVLICSYFNVKMFTFDYEEKVASFFMNMHSFTPIN